MLSDWNIPGVMSEVDSMHTAFRRAVATLRGQAAFATLIGRTQGAVSKMLKDGRPLQAEFVLKVEAATGISRHDLRPDLYPREHLTPIESGEGGRLDGVRG